MSSLAVMKQAKRTFHGLLPEFYDQVIAAYPTPETVQYTFSHKDDNTGNNVVTAIIEIVYTDATQELFSVARRLL